MDLKDILQVGLTSEDFDVMLEGLEAIPEKGFGHEMMLTLISIASGSATDPKRSAEFKRDSAHRMRELEKKGKARADDLVILKSKLILLKRLLLSNDAIRQANEILTVPPVNKY